MKLLYCAFCGTELYTFKIKNYDGETFCSSRHRSYWNQRSEGFHRLVKLHQLASAVIRSDFIGHNEGDCHV